MGEAGDIIRAARKKKASWEETGEMAKKVIAKRPKDVKLPSTTRKKTVPALTPEQNKPKTSADVIGAIEQPEGEKSTFQKVKERLDIKGSAEKKLGMEIKGGAGSIGLVGGMGGKAAKGIGSGFGKNGAWIPAKTLKAMQKAKTGTGELTKVKGVVSTTQTNSKVSKLIKSVWDKALTKTTEVTTTNPITGKVSVQIVKSKGMLKPLAIVGGSLAAIGYAAEKMFGGKNFGNFLGQEEASQAAGMAVWMAQSSDNYDQYLAARALQNQALNDTTGSDLFPFKNVADGIDKYIDITKEAGKVADEIMKDRQIAEDNGESYEETEARIRANQELSEMALRDDWARRAKKAQEEESKFRQKERDAKNADEKRQAKEIADMWTKYGKEKAEREREETEWLANYWTNYNIMKEEAEVTSSGSGKSSFSDNSKSNLNFGLL